MNGCKDSQKNLGLFSDNGQSITEKEDIAIISLVSESNLRLLGFKYLTFGCKVKCKM